MDESKPEERDEPDVDERAVDGTPEDDDDVEAHGQFFHRPSE